MLLEGLKHRDDAVKVCELVTGYVKLSTYLRLFRPRRWHHDGILCYLVT